MLYIINTSGFEFFFCSWIINFVLVSFLFPLVIISCTDLRFLHVIVISVCGGNWKCSCHWWFILCLNYSAVSVDMDYIESVPLMLRDNDFWSYYVSRNLHVPVTMQSSCAKYRGMVTLRQLILLGRIICGNWIETVILLRPQDPRNDALLKGLIKWREIWRNSSYPPPGLHAGM